MLLFYLLVLQSFTILFYVNIVFESSIKCATLLGTKEHAGLSLIHVYTRIINNHVNIEIDRGSNQLVIPLILSQISGENNNLTLSLFGKKTPSVWLYVTSECQAIL